MRLTGDGFTSPTRLADFPSQMAQRNAIDVLNGLLAAECGSILGRLAQADPYVSLATAPLVRTIDRLGRAVVTHEQNLVELIYLLGGVPISPPLDARGTSFHYLDLKRLMPAVLADLERLVAAYEAARGTGQPAAEALIARHLDAYRNGLSELSRIDAAAAPV